MKSGVIERIAKFPLKLYGNYYITFCHSLQKKGSLKAFLQSRLHINPAELKILIVFVYSIIFAAVGVIGFLVGSRNTDTFRNQLTAYFGCEALGVQPGDECERAFDRTAVEVVVDLTLFFTAIYPIMSLIYVVNLQELKMFFTKHCTRMRTALVLE